MRLYKYVKLKAAVSILETQSVRLSNPSSFNDPFDCSYVFSEEDKKEVDKLLDGFAYFLLYKEIVKQSQGDSQRFPKTYIDKLKAFLDKYIDHLKQIPYFSTTHQMECEAICLLKFNPNLIRLIEENKRKLYTYIKDFFQKFQDNLLITCFSKRNDSTLMWSHYADSHKGVCLEYEISDDKVFLEVNYSTTKPIIFLSEVISHILALIILEKKIDPDTLLTSPFSKMINYLFTKEKDWGYEEEVRFICSDKANNKIHKDNEGYFLYEIGLPTKIYLGCNSVSTESIYEIANKFQIPVIKTIKSDKNYRIIPEGTEDFDLGVNLFHHESKVEEILSQMKDCLNKGLYFPAFLCSLLIPEICSNVTETNSDKKTKYVNWVDDFLNKAGKAKRNFYSDLTGEMIWKLREQIYLNGIMDGYLNTTTQGDIKIKLIASECADFNYFCARKEKDYLVLNVLSFCDQIDMVASSLVSKNKQNLS